MLYGYVREAQSTHDVDKHMVPTDTRCLGYISNEQRSSSLWLVCPWQYYTVSYMASLYIVGLSLKFSLSRSISRPKSSSKPNAWWPPSTYILGAALILQILLMWTTDLPNGHRSHGHRLCYYLFTSKVSIDTTNGKIVVVCYISSKKNFKFKLYLKIKFS